MTNKYRVITSLSHDDYKNWNMLLIDNTAGLKEKIESIVTDDWTFFNKTLRELELYFKSPEDAIMFKLVA